MKDSIYSILSRLISVGSKFILITLLAKVMTMGDYGSFQLVSYFVLIALAIFGFEYHMISCRLIPRSNDAINEIAKHLGFIKYSLPFSFIIGIVLVFTLVPSEVATFPLALLFIIPAYAEYFSQEIYRFLIAKREFNTANVLLIFKSCTLLLLVLLFLAIGLEISLPLVLWSYGGSTVILLLVSIYLFKIKIQKNKPLIIPQWSWGNYVTTYKQLAPFIVLVLVTKGLEFFDKYLIEYYYDLTAVGIYAYLTSIAFLVHVFIASGFYLIYMPKLIHLESKNDIPGFKALFKEYSLLVVTSSACLCLLLYFGLDYLILLIDKPELLNHKKEFMWLLFAYFFLNFSLIPRMFLYIIQKDKLYSYLLITTFIINLILNLILLKSYGISGAAIALAVTYLFLGLVSMVFAKVEWNKKQISK